MNSEPIRAPEVDWRVTLPVILLSDVSRISRDGALVERDTNFGESKSIVCVHETPILGSSSLVTICLVSCPSTINSI